MDKPTRLHYIYYACGKKKIIEQKCEERSLQNDRLEDQVKATLKGMEISAPFLDWAIRQIDKLGKSDEDFEEEKREALKRELEAEKKKLANLLQLKISPVNSDGSLLSDDESKLKKKR